MKMLTPLSAPRGRTPWTPEDEIRVVSGIRSGLKYREIGADIGRTANAVQCRVWFLGLKEEAGA